ncbi:hypothetical protein niasHT_036592 [Heterodera trifolii]|uniref:DUF5641 domain-containing protein n=1 Tax=Heterodera trifolii TaxID=157864 RepID=A0ABD2IC63_9BILA
MPISKEMLEMWWKAPLHDLLSWRCSNCDSKTGVSSREEDKPSESIAFDGKSTVGLSNVTNRSHALFCRAMVIPKHDHQKMIEKPILFDQASQTSYQSDSHFGVKAKIPTEINKVELCCAENCYIHENVKKLTYELPKEILLNDFKCEGHFWMDSKHMFKKDILCPAVDECELIECYFCIEQLANSTCYPLISSIWPKSASERDEAKGNSFSKLDITPCLQNSCPFVQWTSFNRKSKFTGTRMATKESHEFFWEMWQKEYLLLLRERGKWDHKSPRLQDKTEPKEGMIVLIHEEFTPRNQWSLGKIIELNGRPGAIRSVQLELPIHGIKSKRYGTMPRKIIITRPVNKIFPLEVGFENPTENEEKFEESSNGTPQIPNEEENSHLEAPIEKETEILQLDNQPIDQNRHGMITRSKANMGTVLNCLSILFAMFALVGAYPTNHCNECKLLCFNKGVKAKIPKEINKVELCCAENCYIHENVKKLTYELPKEILLNDFKCEGHFWMDSKHMFNKDILCPAVDECELIECYFCIEQLANPTCYPLISSMPIIYLAGPNRPPKEMRPRATASQNWTSRRVYRTMAFVVLMANSLQDLTGAETIAVMAKSEKCIKNATSMRCIVENSSNAYVAASWPNKHSSSENRGRVADLPPNHTLQIILPRNAYSYKEGPYFSAHRVVVPENAEILNDRLFGDDNAHRDPWFEEDWEPVLPLVPDHVDRRLRDPILEEEEEERANDAPLRRERRVHGRIETLSSWIERFHEHSWYETALDRRAVEERLREELREWATLFSEHVGPIRDIHFDGFTCYGPENLYLFRGRTVMNHYQRMGHEIDPFMPCLQEYVGFSPHEGGMLVDLYPVELVNIRNRVGVAWRAPAVVEEPHLPPPDQAQLPDGRLENRPPRVARCQIRNQ